MYAFEKIVWIALARLLARTAAHPLDVYGAMQKMCIQQ